MCVICAAAKKRHMKREEVLEAIRRNSAGFFGFTVHDGVRKTVRTLDDREFVRFFDEDVGDDDPWVMHARIPSRGEKTLDNVHGWEEDGIIFCHNMTLTSIDGMMQDAKWEGTDSEFFFRHVFMPFYRGCGEAAYEDGKFCQDLDNIVRHFCGTGNKFLFIMPDNRMVRYGTWVSEPDRKEGGECAFYASNSSYRVYVPAWPKPGKPDRLACQRHDRDGWGCDYDYDCGYGYDDPPGYGGSHGYAPPAKASAPVARASVRDDDDDATRLVIGTLGAARICELALLDVVVHGALEYRSAESTDLKVNVVDALDQFAPSAFDPDTYNAALEGFEALGDPRHGDGMYTPGDFAEDYASELAGNLVRLGEGRGRIVPYFHTKEHVKDGVGALEEEWLLFSRLAGVSVDFSAKSAASFVCVVDQPYRDGNRWVVKKARTEDVLVDRTLDAETSFRAVARLLEFIHGAGGCGKESR